MAAILMTYFCVDIRETRRDRWSRACQWQTRNDRAVQQMVNILLKPSHTLRSLVNGVQLLPP